MPLLQTLGLKGPESGSGGSGGGGGPWASEGLASTRWWSRLPPGARILVGTRDTPVLAAFPYGRGRVFALAEPGWLQNADLAKPGHLALALRLLAAPGKPVCFDEFRHGVEEQPGLAYVLSRYGLVPAACAGALFLGLLAWRASPAEAERPVEGRASGEVRDSLLEIRAGIYTSALKPSDALALLTEDLRQGLSAALGEGRASGWTDLKARVSQRRPALLPRMEALLGELDRHRLRPPGKTSELLPFSRDLATFLKEIP